MIRKKNIIKFIVIIIKKKAQIIIKIIKILINKN